MKKTKLKKLRWKHADVLVESAVTDSKSNDISETYIKKADADNDYVTVNSEQTIISSKEFSAPITVSAKSFFQGEAFFEENAKFNADVNVKDFSNVKTEDGTTLTDYIDEHGGGTSKNAVTIDTAQTITGSKTFKQPIKVNEIDNENGNAMLRYKETEGKNVAGGINYPLTLMGSEDRPHYSKDGSDFEGEEMALMDDVTSVYIVRH